jgi:hypothetical protein
MIKKEIEGDNISPGYYTRPHDWIPTSTPYNTSNFGLIQAELQGRGSSQATFHSLKPTGESCTIFGKGM